jgi:RHS repeat-associated protein
MRAARVAGLAAFSILAVLIPLGPTTAHATTLCAVKANPCPPLFTYGSGTKIEATLASGTKATFLSNIGNIVCPSSTMLGETTSSGGAGKAVQASISNMTFSECKFGATNCTVTAVNLPYTASLTSPETFAIEDSEGAGALAKCGFLVNCTFTTKKATFKMTGGNPAIATVAKLPLERTGGLCPSEATADIEYAFQAPKPLFMSSLPAVIGEFTAEEGFGLTNPAEPNVLRSWTGNSINVASGNLSQAQTDIALGGRGPALEATRSYNAQLAASAKEAGTFGYGWTGPYSAHLTFDEKAETATVHHDNGSTVVFYLVEGKYYPPSWAQASLVKKETSYIYTLPEQLALEFNSSGQLTKVTDRHGNALTLAYKEGKLETVEDAAKRKLTFTYKEGKVESIKDPMGHLVKYTYESGDLATVTLPGEEKARWKFKYDTSHRLTELTDGRGNTEKNEYDSSNRVTLQTDPLERKHKLEYKEAGGVKETTITEPNSSETVQKFNKAGEPTSVTRASGTKLGATTTNGYNNVFELTETTDPAKHTTKYGYDSEGNRTSETDANNNETKWTYNSTHDVKTMTTPKGQTTTYVRNAAGDPETIEQPAPGGETQKFTFKYAKNGDLENQTDPLGQTTTFEYDSYGNRKGAIDPEGNKTTWTYNENSQLIAEVTPRGNEEGAEAKKFETKTERDAQGRALTVTNPLGHTTKHAYDGNGNLETLTDAKEHTTTYAYNADNERIKVKEPDGTITETGYNNMGQVVSHADGNAHVTEYERDLLGQITEEIDPLKRKTTKTYDAAGNLEKVKDAEGRTTTYSYDSGNRVTKVSYSEEATPSVTYEYDKDGNVTVMKDGSGTTKNTYDQLNRLTETENGNKEVVKYEYDLANQQTKITYPNGKSVTRVYDKAGRLEKVTDWLSGETKFAYNRDSQLKSTTFPTESGNKDEVEYNAADQLTSITMKKGAETLASLSYARDKLGGVESVTQTGLPGAGKIEYSYDTRNRLTKAGATSYEYDPAGNPTKLGEATYVYDEASQLEEGGGATYTYNQVGARTEVTPGSGPATTYGYDQAGNLISVERPEEGGVKKIKDTYAYDGNGLRVAQTVSGTTTHMAWDTTPGVPLLLSDGTNSYIYGPGGQAIAQINGEEKVFYLHHDQLGSTRMLTGATGKNEGAFSYKPYGDIEEQTGSVTTPLGYAGEYTNSSTGLVYLRARAYDPMTAQFPSVDPLVSTTGEPYSYAADNPTNRTDPTGLDTHGGCLSFTGEVPMLVGSVMFCVVRDGRAQWALTITVAGSIGFNRNLIDAVQRWATIHKTTFMGRFDFNASGHYQWSNARQVHELKEEFTFRQYSGGFGVTGSYETFQGNGVRGKTYGAGYSPGWRISFSATTGISYTWVIG